MEKRGRPKLKRQFSDDPLRLQQRQLFPVCQDQVG